MRTKSSRRIRLVILSIALLVGLGLGASASAAGPLRSVAPAVGAAGSGELDPRFRQSGSGLNKPVFSIAVQPDGKIIVGGNFTSYNGVTRSRIARLNADGTLDSTFTQTGTGLNDSVYTVALQTDGKIIIGGKFTSYNGIRTPRVARLNADGSLDTSFTQTGSGIYGLVESVATQADGKVLVVGAFDRYAETRLRVARLNADGSLDTAFNPPVDRFTNYVEQVAVQPDGKIVLTGNFEGGVERLNADGSLDASFHQPNFTGPPPYVATLALQPDGAMVIGGVFSLRSGGNKLHGVARLTSDGSLDPAFRYFKKTQVALLREAVYSVAVQRNGRIIAGGGPASDSWVRRLNANGSLDTTFGQAGAGPDRTPDAMALQRDGKVLVGGRFKTYDDSPRPFIVRLLR